MKPKHLPRLWCALQGLLPLGAATETWRDVSDRRTPDDGSAAVRARLPWPVAIDPAVSPPKRRSA